MIIHHTSSLSAEAFIAFIVIFSQLIQPAKPFLNAFYFIQKVASLKRKEMVLQEKNLVNDAVDAVPMPPFSEKLTHRFAYENTLVLKTLGLLFPKGKSW